MNVTVELNCGKNEVYDRELLTIIARDTLKFSNCIKRDDMNITISVALVDEDEIRRVNRELRHKDQITDVISIGDYSDNKDISKEENTDIFLGEVILCYNYIAQISQENDSHVDQEFFTVYSHGILHLLGFEHGEEMYALQDRIGEMSSVI